MIKDDDDIVLYNTKGQTTSVKGGLLLTPYFKAKELACPAGKIIKCHDSFLIHLTYLRDVVGIPFILNSVCRTPAHNVTVDGNKNSLHLTDNPKHATIGSMAADISVRGWSLADLTILLVTARELKWSVGHGYSVVDGAAQGFVHVDLRTRIGMKRTDFYY
jgi:hypothetical protein